MKDSSSLTAERLLERGLHELQAAGIESARFQAELLLRHALGCSREFLLTHLHQPITGEVSGHFFQLLQKRCGHVPVQYLVGSQEFWGLDFRVTPAVLIPRPETEGVVEEALAELERKGSPRIADVGCGSGCIAVALASSRADAELIAIDISPAALAVARENALRSETHHRIRFVSGDLLEPVLAETPGELDAVVSNPPYISDAELLELSPEVAEHEPRLALAGGVDGLDVVRRLLPQAARALAPGGVLVSEIAAGHSTTAQTLVEASGLELLRIQSDLAGIPRVVVARKPA